MDAAAQVLFQSEFSVAVIGNAAGEVALFDMSPGSEPLPDMTDYIERGFIFAGVLTVRNGVCGARCQPSPHAIPALRAAMLPFAQLVRERIDAAKPKGDEVAWLESLYALPDSRCERGAN